jgi:flagellar hook-associated protein 3 FlgL
MRVTANTFPNGLVDQLNQLAIRQNRLQSQAATGQRMKLPEDDPTAMRRVLDLQTESQSLAQYQRNIARHQELADASYGAMKSLQKIVDRAGEIATLTDDLKSPQQLKIYAAEVGQLLKQAVQLSNADNRGDYIFAGSKTDRPPFVAATDTTGQITGVTYQGNTDPPESEIASGVALTTQFPGANTSGSGPRGLFADNRVNADLFGHLIALQQHLTSGDAAAVADGDRVQLGKDEENLIFHVGTIGAVQARLDTTAALNTQRSQSVEGLVSKEVDADLAQTLVRLSETQNAYQAALQSGGTILNRSLLDYLR